MEVQKVLHMNPGDNETSYANNSTFQKQAIMKSRHVIEYSLRKIWNRDEEFPNCFRMADLACSSGPTAILGISNVIDIVEQICQQNSNVQVPEFDVYLNDLPHNDFNNLFKLLQQFHEDKGKRHCFVSGLPGSFYNRLFPSDSLHFVSSFNAVHWLSKVPEGLENNKGNIHLATSSPRDVFEAYLKQFNNDFATFLRLRAEEIKHGGLMVLTFSARTALNPFMEDGIETLSLLAQALVEMSTEGMVEESKIDGFNMPIYMAHKDEVEKIIQREGSFKVEKLEIFELKWDESANNESTIGIVVNSLRAAMEPMLATQFGASLMDELFARFEKHLARRLCKGKMPFFDLVIALTRK